MDQLGNVLGELSTAINGMRIDRVPPPVPYNGCGNVQSFFTAFEKYARALYKDDEESYLQILPTFLEGEPKAIVLSFGNSPDVRYPVVKQRVIHEKNTRNNIGSSPYSDFFSAKRRPGESLTCFSIRLESFANKVTVASEDARKVMVRSKFLSVLPEAMVQQMTIQLGYLNAVTLEQVVRLASILESQNNPMVYDTMAPMPMPPPPVPMAPITSWHSNAVLPSRTPAGGRTTGYQANSRGYDDRKCFSCGDVGHFSRNCPGKNSANRDDSPMTCMFCGTKGHVFADCRKFKERCMQCAFCGSTDHTSYKCKNNPRFSGN